MNANEVLRVENAVLVLEVQRDQVSMVDHCGWPLWEAGRE